MLSVKRGVLVWPYGHGPYSCPPGFGLREVSGLGFTRLVHEESSAAVLWTHREDDYTSSQGADLRAARQWWNVGVTGDSISP